MLSKELRECGLYACLALLVMTHHIGSAINLPLIPGWNSSGYDEVPFMGSWNSDRATNFLVISVVAAIVFGFHQTVWESWRQTTLFLLHRPMPRIQIFQAKLLAGLLILLVVAAIPLLVYCLWAAANGTHASPFYWSMSDPWWQSVEVAVVCYLGAFLSGLRSAHWFGSRTWPLLASAVMAIGLKNLPVWPSLIHAGMALLATCLVLMVLDTSRIREYP